MGRTHHGNNNNNKKHKKSKHKHTPSIIEDHQDDGNPLVKNQNVHRNAQTQQSFNNNHFVDSDGDDSDDNKTILKVALNTVPNDDSIQLLEVRTVPESPTKKNNSNSSNSGVSCSKVSSTDRVTAAEQQVCKNCKSNHSMTDCQNFDRSQSSSTRQNVKTSRKEIMEKLKCIDSNRMLFTNFVTMGKYGLGDDDDDDITNDNTSSQHSSIKRTKKVKEDFIQQRLLLAKKLQIHFPLIGRDKQQMLAVVRKYIQNFMPIWHAVEEQNKFYRTIAKTHELMIDTKEFFHQFFKENLYTATLNHIRTQLYSKPIYLAYSASCNGHCDCCCQTLAPHPMMDVFVGLLGDQGDPGKVFLLHTAEIVIRSGETLVDAYFRLLIDSVTLIWPIEYQQKFGANLKLILVEPEETLNRTIQSPMRQAFHQFTQRYWNRFPALRFHECLAQLTRRDFDTAVLTRVYPKAYTLVNWFIFQYHTLVMSSDCNDHEHGDNDDDNANAKDNSNADDNDQTFFNDKEKLRRLYQIFHYISLNEWPYEIHKNNFLEIAFFLHQHYDSYIRIAQAQIKSSSSSSSSESTSPMTVGFITEAAYSLLFNDATRQELNTIKVLFEDYYQLRKWLYDSWPAPPMVGEVVRQVDTLCKKWKLWIDWRPQEYQFLNEFKHSLCSVSISGYAFAEYVDKCLEYMRLVCDNTTHERENIQTCIQRMNHFRRMPLVVPHRRMLFPIFDRLLQLTRRIPGEYFAYIAVVYCYAEMMSCVKEEEAGIDYDYWVNLNLFESKITNTSRHFAKAIDKRLKPRHRGKDGKDGKDGGGGGDDEEDVADLLFIQQLSLMMESLQQNIIKRDAGCSSGRNSGTKASSSSLSSSSSSKAQKPNGQSLKTPLDDVD